MPAALHLFRGDYSISGATANLSQERAEDLARHLAGLAGVEPTMDSGSDPSSMACSSPAHHRLDLCGVGADKPLVLGATDDEFSMIFSSVKRQLRWVLTGLRLRRLGLTRARRRSYLVANPDRVAEPTAAVLARYHTDRLLRSSVPRIAEAGVSPDLDVPILLAFAHTRVRRPLPRRALLLRLSRRRTGHGDSRR
ncbi:hypothetical protein [Glaciihabitans sp. UYNi722]|uniref:hypothetical protein n=1 Tax=Glaciihabitans sp. UYNi722 TaxID=3156344 RepID=UPI00339AA29A